MEQFDAGRGEGGAIYNRGDIVVNGSANFVTSTAQVGQASNVSSERLSKKPWELSLVESYIF